MKKAIPLLILLVVGIFLYSCSSNGNASNKATAGKDSSQTDSTKNSADNSKKKNKKGWKGDQKEEAIPVEVTTVHTGPISSYILLSSNLETENMVDIYSRVQGLVEKINADEGDYVRKGQVLIELEADEFSLAEQRARVAYEEQKNAFKRAQEMFKKELLSPQEFEQIKFKTEGAKIEWEQAKLNLSYTKITSPISGIVGERLRRLGERIQITDKLFTVINTQEMIAVVYVPEREIERISKKQDAFIFSDVLKDKIFTGWVKRVSPAVDPQSGTFKVTVGIQNVDNKLRPGMFVNVRIVTDTHRDAVLIPKTAVVYENETMNVFVVRDSVARRIRILPGYQDYQNIESLSGIEAGEKIIVVGQAGLKDSTKVKIIALRDDNSQKSS